MQTAQCFNCEWYFIELRCAAFPKGIPEKILSGEHDHTKLYEGDNGIRFKLKDVEAKNKKL